MEDAPGRAGAEGEAGEEGTERRDWFHERGDRTAAKVSRANVLAGDEQRARRGGEEIGSFAGR